MELIHWNIFMYAYSIFSKHASTYAIDTNMRFFNQPLGKCMNILFCRCTLLDANTEKTNAAKAPDPFSTLTSSGGKTLNFRFRDHCQVLCHNLQMKTNLVVK